MPASICRRPRRRTRGFVESPLLVNGVTSAVPHAGQGCPHHSSSLRRSPSILPRTSRMREPAAPARHPPRGDERAAGERRAIARGVGQRRSVSAGPSKPIVCVPGMDPARVEDTSIGRANPARSIARLTQRRARRRVLLGRVVRLVEPRAEVRHAARSSVAARHDELHQDHRAEREFGAATTPMSPVPHAARTAASCALHPVVPITTLMPRAARRAHVRQHGVRRRHIDRDIHAVPASGSSPIPPRWSRRRASPATAKPRIRREPFDRAAHAAVPDDQTASIGLSMDQPTRPAPACHNQFRVQDRAAGGAANGVVAERDQLAVEHRAAAHAADGDRHAVAGRDVEPRLRAVALCP